MDKVNTLNLMNKMNKRGVILFFALFIGDECFCRWTSKLKIRSYLSLGNASVYNVVF